MPEIVDQYLIAASMYFKHAAQLNNLSSDALLAYLQLVIDGYRENRNGEQLLDAPNLDALVDDGK